MGAPPVRRSRVFLTGPAEPGEQVSLPEEARHHLTRVLRLGPGDRLTGVTPDGVELDLELLSGEQARVMSAERPQVEPRVAVSLGFCVPKGGRMDWVVEKAVELGAAALQPLVAERSSAVEAGQERTRRWQRLAEAAARQSRRLVVPEVRSPLPLVQAVQNGPGACLIAHPVGGVPIAEALAGPAPLRGLLLAIGPEGGWTPDEVAQAVAAGARCVQLGPRILRVETAALVALTLALAGLGELA